MFLQTSFQLAEERSLP